MRSWIRKAELRRWAADLAAAANLLTRFPVAAGGRPQHGRAAWAWPVVGAGLGALAGVAAAAALALGAGASVAAVIGLAASLLMTGCLHEDGLADSADGLWGGADPERRLEIMRDSRIGAYGAAALTLMLLARFAGISEVIGSVSPLAAFAACGALSRAVMLMAMFASPQAREDGLAAACGKPAPAAAWTGCAIAVILSAALLGWPAVILAAAAAAGGFAVSWLAIRRIGGHTGDTLGAAQQISETACLLALAILV